MIETLYHAETWISLLTLTLLEVILGIDNIIFISIVAGKLPAERQKYANRLGLWIGMLVRIVLLFGISIVLNLDKNHLLEVFGTRLSVKDIILIFGGLFLVYQSTREIHEKIEGDEEKELKRSASSTMSKVILQMFLLNVVFSLDSVITAVGMAKILWVMIAAVIIAVLIMMWASAPINKFVHNHPTIKILALSFLILIGVSLLAEGFHKELNKGYIYFAMGFAFLVEIVNLRVRK